jgi:hypothetical protein
MLRPAWKHSDEKRLRQIEVFKHFEGQEPGGATLHFLSRHRSVFGGAVSL